MEDTLSQTDENAKTAAALGELLKEHKGGDVLILDLRKMNAWTDFFIIVTTASSTHMDGLERHIKEFCRERNITILRKSRKPETGDDEWRLIDLGPTVIHLMNRQARDFYELERLWAAASTGEPRPSAAGNETPVRNSHSSNSS